MYAVSEGCVRMGQREGGVYKAVDYCHVCQKVQMRFKCPKDVTLTVFYTVFAKIKNQLHIKYEDQVCDGVVCFVSKSHFMSPPSSDPCYERVSVL